MASISSCIIDIEKSIPDKFAKDQRPYKFDDLTFAIESPVDFESLRVNGFPEVKTRFERQSMMYYFDILNGPTYGEVIKEFWMKASVITKAKYLERMVELAKEKPEFIGKTPAEMGIKPFVSNEIESYVAGFRIAFKEDHINEALKLSDGGLVIKSTDSVIEDVDDFIFKPKENPGDKTEWKDLSKIIYRILINSIITKLGGTDQISTIQKLFFFHVGKGNFVDIGKLIFNHLVESITASKPIIRHGRLLSHMFADAIKPFFPGYGTYLISSKIINSTNLRYLQLLKGKKVVHPTHPLLLRETEEDIDECRLIHVSDRDARRIAEAHAGFLKSLGADVGTGESQGLTVRQARILAKPVKILSKRKPVKSPAVSESKKVAKTQKNTGPRTSRKRKLVLEATEEENEQALKDDAIAQVEALKQKEESLMDGYDCGIDPKVFKDMYSKLPPKNIPDDVLAQQTLYGSADGKFATYIGNSSAFRDYFRRLQHPSEIPVKRAFDRILNEVHSKKDLILSKNQPSSEQFNPLQTNPSESQTNSICNDAEQATTSTAPVIHLVDVTEDSDRTPSPPPEKSLTNKDISILDPTPDSEDMQPENDQVKPPKPNP
ncbi:NADH:ubiquinone reductase (H(+)-translocating) [Trifolium repens]|nr:NADH:ubiquinone reductase (H(+)-translocating) [Trifolium repens]